MIFGISFSLSDVTAYSDFSSEGILSLRRKYGKERLENACKRVSESGSVSYSMLRNILQGNLDKTEIHPNVSCTPANEYVRGADAFSNI